MLSLQYSFGFTLILRYLICKSFTIIFDNDITSRNVSKQELEIIQKDKVVYLDDHVRGQSVPYKAMFTDIAIIGVLGTALSNMAAIRLFIQYGPVYLNKVSTNCLVCINYV